ncbi:MAG: bifunctional diaminohydroxyphosphoribosylaminopyrimidine deaminase/5-amino-6-(5-phosphoribosylamino)uracil reductase RibD [Syntrophaceticus sp.]|nr:bifunctional diaminohydroxyphosphoribosylaminopyrimidine deaminase/5-amino-6-(5-phosphoribosylamino)uracil reductase RibD [Syntrophaceticus sp.]MDD3314073.1 bifunctional diaminohydroxyphosphoribosylaminopyrimidine deaminase/5-amino-6-(5-phosphoribosylamino)uracil reductase RibD [Syntrophaceticus sp.]MDD4359560.1 bifunctional diaminohydroxyphosphoribosylaminopyrimidine deaminase/5-amino-6-(5-phosphoribosylamino)uracil reductase RibD [Syntrophaceticus sp.]MDD4783454.1 bifunctional diaminohydrox
MNHEQFMSRALELAEKGRGKTSPNPLVGAVIVRSGGIVGEGYHQKAGTPHAEIHALRDASEKAKGAIMYVTLEPCCHYGRTPPCTEAIIENGIKEVVVGAVDPNPLVAGKGIKTLEKAGIRVITGVLAKDAQRQNEAFIKYIRFGRPFITLKAAISQDGKIATKTGDSKWITGEEARRLVHQMRATNDAIMVGIGTVLADDPLLTVRLQGQHRQPLRVIIDSSLRIPIDSQLVKTASQVATIIAAAEGRYSKEKRAELEAMGVEIWDLPAVQKRVDLVTLMQKLGKREITSLLLEGGPTVNTSALEAGLIDKFVFFQAPLIIGGRDSPGVFGGEGCERLSDCLRLNCTSVQKVGDDLMITAYGK